MRTLSLPDANLTVMPSREGFLLVRLSFVALIAGCLPKASLDEPFTVGIGDATRLASGPTIEITELLEDSRCPPDVQCIWAGRVRFGVTLTTDAHPYAGELTWPDGDLTLGGHAVELLEVTPDPSTEPTAPRQYRATLVVHPATP